MTMTHKQRVFAAIKKEPIDRLPFGARIDLWYNYHAMNGTLPEKYRGWSMVDINKDLGAGTQFRLHKVWKEEYRDLEVNIIDEPPYTTYNFNTPHGKIGYKIYLNKDEGTISAYIVEHLFKSADDYKAIEYLIRHEDILPDYEEYNRLDEMGGEDATIAVGNATGPMQIIMKEIMGYEQFFYELFDNPAEVERIYEALKDQWKMKLKVLVDSPVEFPVLCGNWTDDIHTPLFEKYFLPWLQESSDFLHSHGKLSMIHVDGEIRRLVPYIKDARVDIAECWSPAPMTSLTTGQLREELGDTVAVWGGVASQLFESMYSDEEFDEYVVKLFKEIAPGYRFIVGMGENVSPNGKIERVRRVSELIKEYGPVPLSI